MEAVGRERPIRVDSIRVDSGDLDFARLDAFLAKTRIFPSFSHEDREAVRPFLLAMERSGFQVFHAEELRAGVSWQNVFQRELEAAARDGWVVIFLSRRSILSPWVTHEIDAGKELGAKIVPVLLERMRQPANLVEFQFFDASVDPATAPDKLVELLLRRPV